MADRRPTRGLNPRVRERVGCPPERPHPGDELRRLLDSGDLGRDAMEQVTESPGPFRPGSPRDRS